MLEKLIEIAVASWDRLAPFVILMPFEGGGAIRLGKYHRTLGPGFHWKWPLLERVWEVTTCETTWHSVSQPLTTKDDVQVSLTTVVRYSISDVRPYIEKIYDQKDVLADRTMGLVRRHIAKSTYKELLEAEDPEAKIATALRRAVSKYGFQIEEVTFTVFTKAWPISLLTQANLKDLDN